MSYPITNINIEFKTSCPIEDAVAKLLGWLKGPIYLSTIRVDQPITLMHLENLNSLIFPLHEHLESLREEAIYKFDAAVTAEASDDVKNQLFETICYIENLTIQANLYVNDIEEEIGKKDASSLIIVDGSYEDVRNVHITLKSLDQWAKKKYGITILDDSVLPIHSQKKLLRTKYDQPRLLLQEQRILSEILLMGHDPKNLPKNPSGKPGIKAEIRNKLCNDPLFEGKTVYKKAWDRLLEDKEIQIESNHTLK